MSESPDRQTAWSRYWRQDVLHSLPGSFAGNYAGGIGDFWGRQFGTLGVQQRVLDIGTGNGALPELICRTCDGAMPRVDAIDLADISPEWIQSEPFANRQSVQFHAGVSAEALPFPAQSFDLVVSQYGFEYCPAAQAVPELDRVLKPGGSTALLLHHRDSRLAQVAREELRLAQWLLQPSGFLDGFEAMLPYLAQASSVAGRERLRNNATANAIRDEFNGAMQTASVESNASPFPDLLLEARTFVAQGLEALGGGASMDGLLESCHQYRQSLRDARLRYAELCQCAMDADAMTSFADLLARHDFVSITYAAIAHDNGMLMGWTLTASKPGGQAAVEGRLPSV